MVSDLCSNASENSETSDIEEVKVPSDVQPTALENLYAIVYYLRLIAMDHKEFYA